jgi:hypothetical protein
MSRTSPLSTFALRFILEASPGLTDLELSEAHRIVEQYLNSGVSYETASALYRSKFFTTAPIDRIRQILEVSSDSLPSRPTFPEQAFRRKNHQWTSIEDTRLLSGIHKFGTENWNIVAQYVGNNRTRSQCSQRWQRGLDPRISKSQWSPQEEARLLQLVEAYGNRAWIRISTALGNRSDVQCRYRYHQLLKGRSAKQNQQSGSEVVDDEAIAADEEEEEENEKEKEEDEAVDESGKVEEKSEETGKEEKAVGFPIERIGLDLGTNSTSEIFWLLHP